MKKTDIGKYFSFKFQYVNDIVIYSGYLLDYNSDWILLKHNPRDYEIDGYIILRNKYVTHYKRDNKDKFTERILNLKGHQPKRTEKIPIADIQTILNYLTRKYGVFYFDMLSDTKCWLGKVKKIVGSELHIHYLTPRAKWTNTMPPYKLGNIRTIQFGSDYNNSLMLIAKTKKK